MVVYGDNYDPGVNMNTTSTSPNLGRADERKPYVAPALEALGSVKDLVQGGSLGGAEPGANMMTM